MRLLKRKSNSNYSLTDDLLNDIPVYAILSHTWGKDGEGATYNDIMNNKATEKEGWNKI